MLFNSLTYLIFLPVVVAGYYLLPHKWSLLWLLAASYGFYMAWRPELIVLLLFSTFINYAAARRINDSTDPKTKKRFLLPALWISFGLLFVFKYLVFFSQSLRALLDAMGLPHPVGEFDIILPMGISFYTFQIAAYTIDVYKGAYAAERNFWKVSLFTTFFPQLVAGPIERADHLMAQLFKKHKPLARNFLAGGKYLLLGFFKKTVIADRLAVPVNAVFNAPQSFSGLPSVIAVLFFAFQIYCDFSGYSDIAVGSAKLLGIDLTINFRQPYLSRGIREFWRRWHITLSSWLKDYLYIPLGGGRVRPMRRAANILITFLVSGLWHGANWTFLFWGGLHGLYQVFETKFKQPVKRNFVIRFLQRCLTFALVCLAWIFFRANTLSDAFYMLRHLPSNRRHWLQPQTIINALTGMKIHLADALINILLICLLIGMDAAAGEKHIFDRMEDAPSWIRFCFYVCIAALIMAFGVFYSAGQFIYFQF